MELILKEVEPSVERPIFSEQFLAHLQGPYYDQKVEKNRILQERFTLTENELNEVNAKHYCKWTYFSSSYSWNLLLLWFSDTKIGVDLEMKKERSYSLLEQYEESLALLWGKTWDNFYLLWSWREAIIKASDSCYIEDGEKIYFVKSKKEENYFDTLNFSHVLEFDYNWKQWIVYLYSNEEYVYALTQR